MCICRVRLSRYVCVHVHQYACMFMGHLSVCKFESQWSTQAHEHTQSNTRTRVIPFLLSFFFLISKADLLCFKGQLQENALFNLLWPVK